jgi:hypothetical protein
MSIRQWLCAFLDCANCTEEQEALLQCWRDKEKLELDFEHAQEKIRQLELLVPRPAPPGLSYIVEKDTTWVQGVLTELGADIVRLPLGVEFQLTDKDTFIDFIAWDWVDSFEYHKFYRCGNFSISFKASADQWGVNQVGIVLDYQSGRAYNIVVFPDRSVMLLEPQSDNLFIWEEHAPQFYNLRGAVVVI